VRLLPLCESRRRVRLPLAAMSEEHGRVEIGPRYLCDERPSDGPVLTLAAGPERADEGGGPDDGAASIGKLSKTWLDRFCMHNLV